LQDFLLWFTEGLWHIADIRAYDHILFLLVLFGGLEARAWKKGLWLITAFTVGHSITLALSVLNLVKIRIGLVEFLIPVTILVTALYNIIVLHRGQGVKRVQTVWPFFMVVFFGMIHGLGFSSLLRSMLGRSANILGPLFSFNLGIEAGQILIIAVIMVISLAVTRLFGVKHTTWRFFLSAAAFGIALVMAAERL
jgi:hypothetical protein